MAIVEIKSINPESCSDSSCVIEVGYDLTMNEEEVPDVSSAQIFRVPRLTPYCKDHLYSPHLVSIGPFHYGKKELQGMEKSKSEAVRRMQKRIQRSNPHISVKSIVEQCILFKEKKIRKFYGEQIPLTSIELAWMVTRDACFVYEFIVNYVKVNRNAQHSYETQGCRFEYLQCFYGEEVSAFKWKYDPVFDADLQNPIRERLMTDILLFENQIPLWILKDLLKFPMGSAEAAKQKVENLMNMLLWSAARHEFFMWKPRVSYNMYCKKHVLEVLYRSMVGRDFSSADGELLDFPPSSQNHRHICFSKSADSIKAICGRLCNPFFCSSSNKIPCNTVDMVYLKLPTASELVRGGVKIQPVLFKDIKRSVGQDPTSSLEYSSAIRWIRFDEKTSTLYLPQFKVTLENYSVVGSIVAMEVGAKGYGTKPMIQFALLIDELIDNEEDVAVLKTAEVINNFFGSNKQLADLFNLCKGIAHVKGCKAIDDVRMGLHKYTRRKYKKLWSEFVSAYFSKPWLVAGSMAAVLLIVMTVAQDLCLFFTCNPYSH
ncbi:hypothetical protein SUGI_1174280 [Cryptomeria japonica]|uniref:UPF0481 protein At3g47200-like n=1 Tax=Cryptomeria japonica TaxID=3369 RepID=UPI002414B6C0|nr:UPF0481 protein At3g47200-like [Cryptomeria japonica]GLJ54656.1 hypothetical protein SUGI_1174280 [Cryptomeria japonica]